MRADGRAARMLWRARSRGAAQALRSDRADLCACGARRDQGIGDFETLARAAEAAGDAGAAYLGVSPMHMLFPRRPRPGEPLLSVGPALPRSDPDRRFRPRSAARRRRFERRSRRSRPRPPTPRRRGSSITRRSGGSSGWRSRRCTARSSAPSPRGPARRSRPTISRSSPKAANPCGGLRRSRLLPRAISARPGARGRKRYARAGPRPSRRLSTRTRKPSISRSTASGSPTANSPAPPSGRGGAGLESDFIAISRSAPRLTAPRPGPKATR